MNSQNWDRMVYDFGHIPGGSQQKAEFNYIGEGDVIQVITGCGCTSSTVNNKKVTLTWNVPQLSPLIKETLQSTSRIVTVKAKEDNTVVEYKLTLKATRNG